MITTLRGTRIAWAEGDRIGVAMSRQFFAVSRDVSVPIFAPIRGMRLRPRFGTPKNGLSDVSTIDIKARSIAPRGASRNGDLPKNCHLLPSTAIWSRKTATTVSTVPFLYLPFEGMPASLGPGLRTASGA